MSEIIDPLKITTQPLHRFWFTVETTPQWYDIIRELKHLHGREWRGQPRVKRVLDNLTHYARWFTIPGYTPPTMQVWFDIPDPATATWISVKLGIPVSVIGPTANK